MKLNIALSTAFGLLVLSAVVISAAADMAVIMPLRGSIENVSNFVGSAATPQADASPASRAAAKVNTVGRTGMAAPAP
ncbi:hypothetical protein [Pseudomonas sp. GL-B-16]|uniref:hypothetical protein n=1 Tax=Pseudomonas sp. GL-B-16 TaxID=2832373 RepID=UPI003988E01A